MSEELKPCPFCGVAAWVEPVNPEIEGDSWTQISCGNDLCRVGVVVASHDEHNHRTEAIEEWNTRAPDPRIAELEAENKRMRGRIVASTESMERTLAAMDRYNEQNGTAIIGPSLLTLGKMIATNRQALKGPNHD